MATWGQRRRVSWIQGGGFLWDSQFLEQLGVGEDLLRQQRRGIDFWWPEINWYQKFTVRNLVFGHDLYSFTMFYFTTLPEIMDLHMKTWGINWEIYYIGINHQQI